jgi:hypothetical protein
MSPAAQANGSPLSTRDQGRGHYRLEYGQPVQHRDPRAAAPPAPYGCGHPPQPPRVSPPPGLGSGRRARHRSGHSPVERREGHGPARHRTQRATDVVQQLRADHHRREARPRRQRRRLRARQRDGIGLPCRHHASRKAGLSYPLPASTTETGGLAGPASGDGWDGVQQVGGPANLGRPTGDPERSMFESRAATTRARGHRPRGARCHVLRQRLRPPIPQTPCPGSGALAVS